MAVVNLLVVAYQYPTIGALWADLTAAQAKYAIANISSGPGTAPAVSDYTAVIGPAQAAGVTVLGYVDTNFGAVAPATVAANVALWRSLYGVTDIFLDRVSASSGGIPYIQGVVSSIRTANPGKAIVFNHGVIPDPGYAPLADVLVVFEDVESNWAAFTPPAWFKQYAPSKFAVLTYSASGSSLMATVVGQAQAFGIGNIYVTDGDASWSATPTYWAAEAALTGVTTLTPTRFARNGAGLDVSALLAAPAHVTLQFANSGQEILLVAAGASAETVTVGIGTTVLGQPVASFPAVTLTSGHMAAFGPFDTPVDQPGGTSVQVTLSTTTAITAGLIRQAGAY